MSPVNDCLQYFTASYGNQLNLPSTTFSITLLFLSMSFFPSFPLPLQLFSPILKYNSALPPGEIASYGWDTSSSTVATTQTHLTNQYYDICIRCSPTYLICC